MQIDIDFEVFKALTAIRLSESDSYNAVIRRLVGLPHQANALSAFGPVDSNEINALADVARLPKRRGLFGTGTMPNALSLEQPLGALASFVGGAWYSNVHFPNGTKFRATYKGQTHFAEIKDGRWVGTDGEVRNSPSEAASAISNTNVNGWRFWFVQRPGDPSWRKMDDLKP